jgi:serine/threonine protein kinase
MKTNFPPSDTASPALLSISKGNTLEDVDETRLPYTWLSNLGSGACGIVEEVEDINTGAVYARKLLRLKSWNKRSMKELFENEIEIIKSLGEHHHLIQVFATYTTKDKLGLIRVFGKVSRTKQLRYEWIYNQGEYETYPDTGFWVSGRRTILHA